MKAYGKVVAVFLIVAIASSKLNAQKTSKDSTGFPGDNFSLQGALQMFQQSSSPEEFEKLLNKYAGVLNEGSLTELVEMINKTH